jgi:hypothetical protein
VIGAFAYLILHSTRNRLLAQLRRLRTPRYAIALALGIGYFWLMFFRRAGGASTTAAADMVTRGALAAMLPVIFLLLAAYAWIFGADRSALAFSEAEVSMLFTAPISRRGLIVYKLVRSQAATLVTSVIWATLFHHGAGRLERGLGYWVLLSTLSMHRLGVALIRASREEHGVTGLRRNWLPVAVFGAAAAAVGAGLFASRELLSGASLSMDFFSSLEAMLARAPLSWVLYPFHVAVAPAFAAPGAAWARAMGPALVLLGLHVLWVLRTDTAFEEAAAQASSERARRREAMRSRGASSAVISAKAKRRTLRLRPAGAPSVAIVWKNYLWLMRAGQLRAMIGLPLAALICVLGFAGRLPYAEMAVAVLCLSASGVILLFGPMSIRNDLRGELQRLPMLKTLPLRGRQIVLAEVVSSAAPTSAMQYLLVAVGMLALSFADRATLEPLMRVALLVTAPFVLLGLNLANFTIHNGIALLYPGWVRLGERGGGGIEGMGLMMLSLIITTVLLVVLLIVPGLAGGALYYLLRSHPIAAVLCVGSLSGVLLAAEARLAIAVLGGAFERTEPMQIG